MKSLKLIALSALVVTSALTLQGCIVVADGHGDDYKSSDFRELEEKNRRLIAGLDDGVNVSYVREVMGIPEFADRVSVDNVRYDVLYYRTQRVDADGNTTRDECTPLVFEDGALRGTGHLALSRIPQLN